MTLKHDGHNALLPDVGAPSLSPWKQMTDTPLARISCSCPFLALDLLGYQVETTARNEKTTLSIVCG